MPIPIAIASFNKKVTNRLTAPFDGPDARLVEAA